MTAWTKFRSALRAFRSAREGNVAIIFGFSAIPLMVFVGVGYDYSHANGVRADMQAALDSTALMLAKEAATLSQGDLEIKAGKYFRALFNRPEASIKSIDAAYTTDGGSAVKVSAAVDVPTDFIHLYNILCHGCALEKMTINGESTTKWGTTLLRVALVLDNTGSMADAGKMDALKTATKSLLSQLKTAATKDGDVYVSIIPFAKDVNVGSANYNATWIDWTDWNAANATCTQYKQNGQCQTWTPKSHSTWNGCIVDRGPSNSPGNSTWDQVTTPPDGTVNSEWPAEQYKSCPTAMMGLNYDWNTMESVVDSMQPNGSTNQPIGLVWGWQSLVGGGPLSVPAKNSNYTYQEAIILLSDGLNTENRWSKNQSQVDNRMYDSSGNGTCANIKAAGISIYTIQVNTGGDPTSTLLNNCASKDKTSGKQQFYMLTNPNDLITVFNQIGTDLTKLRVAQ